MDQGQMGCSFRSLNGFQINIHLVSANINDQYYNIYIYIAEEAKRKEREEK